jgi:hypothetical protein
VVLGAIMGGYRGTNGVKVVNRPGIRRKVGGSSGYTGRETRQSEKEVERRRAFKVVRISMNDAFLYEKEERV